MTYYLVINTCPDQDVARHLADTLVQERLAACVNIVAGVESVYEWQGELHHDAECLLYIKTRADNYRALETRLRLLHPYELPEIIAVPIADGLAGYLNWIEQQTDNAQ